MLITYLVMLREDVHNNIVYIMTKYNRFHAKNVISK